MSAEPFTQEQLAAHVISTSLLMQIQAKTIPCPETFSPDWFAMNGYYRPKQLADGSWCALHRLMFTTSLIIDMSETSWYKRYCFQTEAAAINALDNLQTVDDIPTGFIASRG